MDNMQMRKAQLEKLDNFVKTLYDETLVFAQYMNMKDLEMLYLHIHELIEEMLKCKNTDEFMAMIEDLHRAVAGVLIIAIPKQASTVMEDMKEAHDGFSGESFDEMLKDLQKSSVQKFGGAKDKRSKHDVEPTDGDAGPEEEVDNDPEELIDLLDLAEHVTKPKKKKKKSAPKVEKVEEPEEEEDDIDPLEDLYEDFK